MIRINAFWRRALVAAATLVVSMSVYSQNFNRIPLRWKWIDNEKVVFSYDGTYTDAAWTAAEQKAQSLLDEWKVGEHTEDSFAFLAAENSADTGSASNGGLYEEVYPGQMVDAFDAWCFDAARQPGDTGIVKTEYGYHVMYFSSVCEHPYWYVRAESDYLNKLSADVSEEVSAKFESAESVQNAALADILQN